MTDRPEPPFTAAERRAIVDSLPPLQLDASRVQQTMRLVASDKRHRQVRKQLVVLASAASLGILLASLEWRWSGTNTDGDLTIGVAMDITRRADQYDEEEIRSAAGKVWMDCVRMVKKLQEKGLFTPRLRDAVLASLDSPEPVPVEYHRGFEDVRWRLDGGETPTAADEETLIRAMCAGVYAIRTLGARDPKHQRGSELQCRYLRSDLTDAPRAEQPASPQQQPPDSPQPPGPKSQKN